MAYKKKQEIIEHLYECDVCENKIEANSERSKDRPEGYYVHIRRVTEAQRHRISDELFFCTKDCLITFVTYRILV